MARRSLIASPHVALAPQAFFIYLDEDMRDTKTGERCNPNTWTLSDDLGTVPLPSLPRPAPPRPVPPRANEALGA